MANTINIQPWVDPGSALTTEADNAILAEIYGSLGNLSTLQTSAGGLPFLGLDRTGGWKYGQGATEPEPGSYWAIDPRTAKFGYIAWVDGKPRGKVMVPVTEKRPLISELDAALPWQEQVSVELLCVSGEDKDTRVLYETSSGGGKKAFLAYVAAMNRHKHEEPAKPVAVVQLTTSSYPHPQYGKTIEPVFKICGWATLGILNTDAVPSQAKAAAETTPVEPPASTGRRRRQVGA